MNFCSQCFVKNHFINKWLKTHAGDSTALLSISGLTWLFPITILSEGLMEEAEILLMPVRWDALWVLEMVTVAVSSAVCNPRSPSPLTVEKQSDVVPTVSPSACEPLRQQWLTGLSQSFYVVTRTVSIFCHFFALALIMLLPEKCICFKGNNTD